ncbi:hypothetical protein AVEN_221525-1 [Araneus ventricosus]|uniref:Uncharacterized protein n=1 Tax=Araneus ventricosus TaxID=182803 RepID=A0A4Y2QR69_ARAVE|nr:hypothetical protein AVEN_221525-1 [Araneus ventricosus]
MVFKFKHFLSTFHDATHPVIISDCVVHDTVAVQLFQCLMIDFLKQNLSYKPEKLNYFSDGAISQYKNKSNFLDLCNHEKDFGIKAEWNFFALSHGKNACDGVGGTVKQLAALASLQMVYNDQIMTPRQLYDWAKKNIANINFLYSTTDEDEAEEKILKSRFEAATSSFSQESTIKIVSSDDSGDDLDINDIVGFATCQYLDKRRLGCVLEVEGIKISLLEPRGPSPSFIYPQFTDILVVHKN